MIVVYVHEPRAENFDRARAVAAQLGESAILVSAHPPRLGWSADWRLLPDSEVGTWAAWLVENTPETVIVDGPVSHARAVKDVGARLVMVASPGDGERGTAYAEAAAILAPWPEDAIEWPAAWRERTIHLGAVGWRAAQEDLRSQTFRPLEVRTSFRHCVAVWPTGGGPDPRERRAISIETPGWRWIYAPERALHEPGPIWSALMRADVTVCAPSLMTFAALARFGVPAVLAVPDRPSPAAAFLAEAAGRTAPVVVSRPWPQPEDWSGLLDEARGLEGKQWASWDPELGLAELGTLAVSAFVS